MYRSTLHSLKTNNSDSEHALRVCLTQNNASLAKQSLIKFRTTLIKQHTCSASTFKSKSISTCPTISYSEIKYSQLYFSDHDFASRIRLTQNKLTLTGHNPLLFNQPYISHNSNASFVTHTNDHQIKSKLASHSTNTINTPLQIEPQIALYKTPNTRKAPLAYQNQNQFTELSHFNLSITNKPQFSSLISTQKSHTVNYSRAQLVNSKKSLFAQTQSEIQLSSPFSMNLIENSKTSSKVSQQVSSMEGKSALPRSSRTSSRVSFTDNPTPNTPRQSSSQSNISTPLTNIPQVLSSDKVVGKIFNKGLLASLTSKGAVLKEVRDCIIRSDEERLKALNHYPHSYTGRDLNVSSGCVSMDEKVAIPNFLRDALVEDLHASHPGSWGMVCMAQRCWWPYMNRDLLVRAIECKSCTAIGKNLKSIIPAKQFQAHKPCIVPNQEIQIDFAGPINNEKEHEIYFLTCIDRFSKHSSAEIFGNANASNVIKFLENYIHILGVPRSLRIDQARCLIGN